MANPLSVNIGEDRKFTAVIVEDAVPKSFASATITASLITGDSSPVANGPTVTCADTSPANWSAGVVVVAFTDVDTAAMTPARNQRLEIKIVEADNNVVKIIPDFFIEVRGTVL